MKNILFFLGTVLLMCACGENTTVAPTENAAPIGSVNTADFELINVEGGYQRAVRKSPDGKVVEQGMLKEGRRNGTWAIYDLEKGFPSSVANFVDDRYSGPYFKYNKFGQLELACGYTDNQLDGHFSKFDRAKLLETGFYKNGQMEGEYIRYHPGKDVMEKQLFYKNGQLHGAAKFFNDQGELIMEYEYNNGEKVSGGIVK